MNAHRLNGWKFRRDVIVSLGEEKTWKRCRVTIETMVYVTRKVNEETEGENRREKRRLFH